MTQFYADLRRAADLSATRPLVLNDVQKPETAHPSPGARAGRQEPGR